MTIPLGAILYQRAVLNPIGVTAATSNNVGYLATDRTQLEVVGQLTGQDPTDMYNFTYQSNGPVRLSLTNVDGTTSVRIKLLDGSGLRVIADNQGTTQQQQAFTDLTSSTGLNLSNGSYVVSVTYGAGGDKSQKQDYTFQLDSGNTFTSDYRTLGSAVTIQNTLLSGGSLGYNPLSSTAALLTSEANGSSINIFGVLSVFPTSIFA